MSQTEPAESTTGSNHPLSPRMAAIAFLNQNITVACLCRTHSPVGTTIRLCHLSTHLPLDSIRDIPTKCRISMKSVRINLIWIVQ